MPVTVPIPNLNTPQRDYRFNPTPQESADMAYALWQQQSAPPQAPTTNYNAQYPAWFWSLSAQDKAYYQPQIEAGWRQAARQQLGREQQGVEVFNPTALSGIPSMDEVSNAWNAMTAGRLSREEADRLYNSRFPKFESLGLQARIRPEMPVYTSQYGNITAGELYQRLAADGLMGRNPTPVWEIPLPENAKQISGLSNWTDPWAAELSKRGLTAKIGTYIDPRSIIDDGKEQQRGDERLEIEESWRPGSDAWHRKQNQEGMWAPDYVWAIDERNPSKETSSATQETQANIPQTTVQSATQQSSQVVQPKSQQANVTPSTTTPSATTTTPETRTVTTPTTANQINDPSRISRVTWFGPNGATYGALLKRGEQLQFKDGQWVAPEGAPVYMAAPGQPLVFPGERQAPIGQLVNPPVTTPQNPVTPQITIPKAVTERRESFAPAPDTSADSQQVLPQAPLATPQVTIPKVISNQRRESFAFAPQAQSDSPGLQLPDVITNQLPQTIVPTQRNANQPFSPQAYSTSPSSLPSFQPPKSIPIPDLSQMQSGTPAANNLFATINGLQNRNRNLTTAPQASGFYGGFY